MLEEEIDIEQRKAELKQQIERTKMKIELIARRSGRPRIDKGEKILKNRLAKLNSEYIHLISRKYIEGEDELW